MKHRFAKLATWSHLNVSSPWSVYTLIRSVLLLLIPGLPSPTIGAIV